MNSRLGIRDVEPSDGVGSGTRTDISFDIDIGIRHSLAGLLVNHLSVDGECLCRGAYANGHPYIKEQESFHVCLSLVFVYHFY